MIAAETFSDLRTVAIERAPFIFTRAIVEQTFQLAKRQGQFRVDAFRPLRAASEIKAPVLLIHGERDTDTSPDHSRRVFAALNGPKRLLIVPEAGHNNSIRPEAWHEIENWLEQILADQSR